jgi:hypothetical protein
MKRRRRMAVAGILGTAASLLCGGTSTSLAAHDSTLAIQPPSQSEAYPKPCAPVVAIELPNSWNGPAPASFVRADSADAQYVRCVASVGVGMFYVAVSTSPIDADSVLRECTTVTANPSLRGRKYRSWGTLYFLRTKGTQTIVFSDCKTFAGQAAFARYDDDMVPINKRRQLLSLALALARHATTRSQQYSK